MIPSITAPPPSGVLDKLNFKKVSKRGRPAKGHTVLKPGINLNGMEYDIVTVNADPNAELYIDPGYNSVFVSGSITEFDQDNYIIQQISDNINAGSAIFNNCSGNIDELYYTYKNNGEITFE